MERMAPEKPSSLVKSFGHEGRFLEVEMVSSRDVYLYWPVEQSDFEAMRRHPSAGKYLNEYIKPRADCWKLVAEKAHVRASESAALAEMAKA